MSNDQSYTVEGLAEPVEIIVDDNGVPHIFAGEHYDAFFVQGFNAARDRLWQIDLWRKRGLGELSNIVAKCIANGWPTEMTLNASRRHSPRGSMLTST